MPDPNCPKCKGSGYKSVGDQWDIVNSKVKRCSCVIKEMYKEHLGPAFSNVGSVKKSPYLKLCDKDAYITSLSTDFYPHLKGILITKGLDFKFSLTNDDRILRVWLSQDNMGEEDTENYVTSLHSFERFDLVILELGLTSYKNQALPGVLTELIKIRNFVNKPVWVVDSPERPFNSGHLAYSLDLDVLLKRFERVKIEPNESNKASILRNDKKKGSHLGHVDLSSPTAPSQKKKVGLR